MLPSSDSLNTTFIQYTLVLDFTVAHFNACNWLQDYIENRCLRQRFFWLFNFPLTFISPLYKGTCQIPFLSLNAWGWLSQNVDVWELYTGTWYWLHLSDARGDWTFLFRCIPMPLICSLMPMIMYHELCRASVEKPRKFF